MPPPAACSDWTSRSVPECWGPERLAAFVEGAVSAADGMLFTATPREELEGIGRFQQLKDQAWVGLNREIVAAYNRANEVQREFAADEVALAIGAAPGTGARVVATALSAAALLLEQRQAIVLVALARFDGQAPGELARLVRRLVLLIDRVPDPVGVARPRRRSVQHRPGWGGRARGRPRPRPDPSLDREGPR